METCYDCVMEPVANPEPVVPLIERLLARSATEPTSTAWLDRLDEQLERAGQGLREIVKGADRVVAGAGGASPGDLDELVGVFQDLEEKMAADLRNLRADQGRWSGPLQRIPRESRLRFSSLIHRHEESLIGAAEAIRDVRWRLLALQARTDEEGDAPVFDDPDALERYLGKR